MGLDTSHDCWHGSYTSFHKWREWVAEKAGLPPLDTMEGFGGETPWRGIKTPLRYLLNHSDCDGQISGSRLLPIAEALEAIVGGLGSPVPIDEEWCAERSLQFASGLRLAHSRGEKVEFH